MKRPNQHAHGWISFAAAVSASILPALGQISYQPITSDADSGIDSSNTYTHAIDFGNQPGNGGTAVINGVVFANGGPGSFPSKAGTSQTVGTGSSTVPRSHGGNNNSNVGGGMEDLVHDMLYNDATTEILLTGLTPGQQYRFRLYNRQWGGGAGAGRGQDIGFETNGVGSNISQAEDTGFFEQDDASLPDPNLASFNTVNALSYDYTLSPGVTTLKVYINREPGDGGTYHLYGLTNEEVGPDLAAPVIESTNPYDSPTDDYYNGAYFRTNLVATFDEAITLLGGGTITLTDLTDGSDNRTIDLPDDQVSVSELSLIITPDTPLEFGNEYEVTISGSVLRDLAESPNTYGGTTVGEWTFTVAPESTSAPAFDTVFPFLPENGQTDQLLDTYPEVLFDQNIVLGVGVITLRNLTSGQDTVIPTTDTDQLVVGSDLYGGLFGNALLTIYPATPLDPASDYAILIDPAAVASYSEIASVGITDDTTWNFSTASSTEFNGANKTDGDNWSVDDSWTVAVPFGGLNAEVLIGKQATSDGGYADPFTGDLFLRDGALLQIGYQSPQHQADFNALGTPGTSTIYMKDASELRFRAGNNNGASPTMIPKIELLGDALITMATGSEPVEDFDFPYGINGAHTLTFKGKGNQDALLTSPNTFTEVVFSSTEGSYDVFAQTTGSLGGDVTVEAYGVGPAADLTIAAEDAIADNATLALNGSAGGTLITMNADDTVAHLSLNGFSYPAGTYGRIGTPGAADNEETWIAGNGVLTVTGQLSDPISPTAVEITDDSAGGSVFISLQPTLNFTLTFNEPGTFTGAVGDFVNHGSAPVNIASVTQISDREVRVSVTATGTGTVTLASTASTSFEDLFGNTLSGPFIDDSVIRVRDIADMSGELGILNLAANGGKNPATGELWQPGDSYRFIFATSSGRNASSTNILDYNNFIQGLANASALGGAGTLGSVTWKALASTSAISAKANTGTDTGPGESIWLLDGTSLIADDYADLYASNSHSNSVKLSELGTRPYDGGDYTSVWTGSDTMGNIKANDELGAADGTSHTGLWGATSGAHWIDRFSIDQTRIKGMYGMSEVLTIQSLLPPAPEIAVRQDFDNIPSGTGSHDFGSAALNSDNDLIFTIYNFGDASLNLTGSPLVEVVSGDTTDFSIQLQPPTNPVPALTGTTTFTVRFKPQASGARNATILIANDDADENPFTFMVTGTGDSQSPYEAWAGAGGGFGDDDNKDGVDNGIAWLLGAANPNVDAAALLPTASQDPSGNLVLSFNVLNAANRGTATMHTQHSSDLGLSDAWDAAGNEALVPDTSATVNGVTFAVTTGNPTNGVTATIPHTQANGGGQLFGRLIASE